jgi:hypothetical protein
MKDKKLKNAGKLLSGCLTVVLCLAIVIIMTACDANEKIVTVVSREGWFAPAMSVSFAPEAYAEDGDIELEEIDLPEPMDFRNAAGNVTTIGASSGGFIVNQSVIGTPADLIAAGAVKVTVKFAYNGDDTLFGRFYARVFAGDGQDDHYDPNYGYYGDITRADMAVLWQDDKGNWFNINKNGGIGGFTGYGDGEYNYTHSMVVPSDFENMDGVTLDELNLAAAGNSMLKITKDTAGDWASMDFYICAINLLDEDNYDSRYAGIEGKNNEYTGIGYTFVFSFEGPSQHEDHLHFNGTNTLAAASIRIIVGEHDHGDE